MSGGGDIYVLYLFIYSKKFDKVVTWVSGGGDIQRHYPQDILLKSLISNFCSSYDL